MHELTLAQNIVSIVEAKAREAGAQRVRSVHLRVGALTGVVPDSLQFCFDICVRGTPVEGAHLEIERVPLLVRCARCAAESAVEDFQLACGLCGGIDVQMVSGRELMVDEIEVD